MSGQPNPLERIARTPLMGEIARSRDWAITVTNSDRLELFLNPDDAGDVPEGWRLMGMPIRKSVGVPAGKALIFDRRSGQYIRRGEQLRTS